jgi:hypothetical protein
MRGRFALVCVAAVSASVVLSPASFAVERKFVPQGHTYSPNEDRLPLLNSNRDRVNSQADIYESEIYRIERERSIQQGEWMRHIQHDLSGGANFRPYY